VIVFPNCKINLGLHILQKREDGFHDIETVFYPINIKDALEIIPKTHQKGVMFSASGLPIIGPEEANLCIRAYELLKKDFPELPGIKMHLHKVIPMGAGLGGGSANGAFTLLLLNKQFRLQLSVEQLAHYAQQLGSDCAFFILNKPSLATGKGEVLLPLELDLSAYKLLVVYPGIHINTGWAFSHVKPEANQVGLKELVNLPVTDWKENITNNFEPPVFKQFPELKEIKNKLYESGALYASLTGSGSTLFGLFEKEAAINLSFPPHYFVQELSLQVPATRLD